MSTLHRCTDGSEFSTAAGLCYRKVTLDAISQHVEPHRHAFAHDMIVTRGSIIATLDDVTHTLHAGDTLTVPADAVHSAARCPCCDIAQFLCTWPQQTAEPFDTTRGIAL